MCIRDTDKGERTLRAEVVVHNSKELGCKRSLEYFEQMMPKLENLMNNFISNLTYAHVAILDDDTMNNLSKPVKKGKSNISGINISPVSYTHLRAHETPEHLVCRLL